jgi:Glycosyl hydrolase family 46/Putative peptidoglycan binding domain
MERIVRDVPDSQVNFIVATMENDGATVTKTSQGGGLWTITGVFPDPAHRTALRPSATPTAEAPVTEAAPAAPAPLRPVSPSATAGATATTVTNPVSSSSTARLLFAKGARGAPVKKIQKGVGFVGDAIDGDFGPDTTTAVGDFQKTHAMLQTGEVDTDTWGAITKLPVPTLEERALALTATFEGHGFELAQGNFDGAGITWGIIGFTLKHGEVGKIVREMQVARPDLVKLAFGDLTPELLRLIDLSLQEQLAFADSVSIPPSKARLAEPWRSCFRVFGLMPEVQEAQLRHAHEHYFQPAQATANKLHLKTELGVALAFDIHVQNGGVKDDIVRSLLGRTFTSELAQREALANAVADSSNPEFKEDVRSRKLTIAQGKGIVHGGSFVLKNWGLDEIIV